MAELHTKSLYAFMPLQAIQHAWAHLMQKSRTDRVLTFSIVVAVLLHLIFIFAITFAPPKRNQAMMQDIALAVTLSKEPNPDADYLAQSNQKGAGVLRTAHRLTSPAQMHNDHQAIQAQSVTVTLSQQEQPEQEAAQAGERTITTTASQRAESQAEKNKRARQQRKQQRAVAATASMIATLEAQYATQKQAYSKTSNAHTVDSVSSRADPSAIYMNQFRRKVEKVGNHNYPVEARNRGLKGDVRLMVIMLPDGTIRKIKLLKSSGSALLDEAAKQSVHQGEPYARFDQGMHDYTELRIIRTWRFSDEDELEVDN
jgi:protein TonB